jgi:hypothetical protein
MALQATHTAGSGRETLDLVQAARLAAGNQPTPILLSLLAAREALGHARSGDRAAATSAVIESRRWLDHGRRGDEPFWLDFWGPADLALHEMMVALRTGQGNLAETAARRAVASVDAGAFPRNHTAYASHLGLILIRRRQLDEAITITSDAVQRVDAVRGSGRIVARLTRTVDLLGQQNYQPAKLFATAARRLLPTSV